MLGKKISSDEPGIIFFIRSLFYKFMNKISETKLTENTTGSGIFDKSVINQLKNINDPYPYLRGLLNELSEEISTVEFNQPKRLSGITKNNIFTLYDIGMLGIIKHSRAPLRLVTFLGFLLSFFIALFMASKLACKILILSISSTEALPIAQIEFFFI